MLIKLACQPWQESRREKNRHQNQRDADNGTEQFAHGFDRGFAPGHARFDVARHAFHDDNRVVDNDADDKHKREQRREVDGEAKRGHRCKSPDDGNRHRGRGHQRSAPILEEDKNDDQHQDAGLDKGDVNFLDRGLDKDCRIERNPIDEARREIFGELIHFGAHTLGDVEGIR